MTLNKAALADYEGARSDYIALETAVYPDGFFKREFAFYLHALADKAHYIKVIFFFVSTEHGLSSTTDIAFLRDTGRRP
jgi:hypothetical protein